MITTHRTIVSRVVSLLLMCLPATGFAQTDKEDADALFESKFAIDPNDPAAHVPTDRDRNESPLDFAYFIMNLGEMAQAAEKRGDRAAQLRYYQALAKAAPDRNVGFSKLCGLYELEQQYDTAEHSCAAAIALPGAMQEDFARYVRVMFQLPGELRPDQVDNLRAVDAHLQQQAKDSPILTDIRCQLAIKLKDAELTRACEVALQVLPEADIKRVSYAWSLAMGKHDYAQAGQLLERAEHSSLPPALVERMRVARQAELPWWRRFIERIFSDEQRPVPMALAALSLFGIAIMFVRMRGGYRRRAL